MEPISTCRTTGRSSFEKLVAICLGILAVISPLYINRKGATDPELEDEPFELASWLPLLLFVLILAIGFSFYFDRGFSQFDPNWIHRVGGSSAGIVVILVILALVLKCKA